MPTFTVKAKGKAKSEDDPHFDLWKYVGLFLVFSVLVVLSAYQTVTKTILEEKLKKQVNTEAKIETIITKGSTFFPLDDRGENKAGFKYIMKPFKGIAILDEGKQTMFYIWHDFDSKPRGYWSFNEAKEALRIYDQNFMRWMRDCADIKRFKVDPT